MSHLHYSPFQWSTAEQTILPKKEVMKEKSLLVTSIADRKRKTRNLNSTIPLGIARSVSSHPNAFISPNSVDVMRDIKDVFLNIANI